LDILPDIDEDGEQALDFSLEPTTRLGALPNQASQVVARLQPTTTLGKDDEETN